MSAPTPAFPRTVFAAATAPQPTPASAAVAAKRPIVRWSSGCPPRTFAAPRATAPDSADSPLATANSSGGDGQARSRAPWGWRPRGRRSRAPRSRPARALRAWPFRGGSAGTPRRSWRVPSPRRRRGSRACRASARGCRHRHRPGPPPRARRPPRRISARFELSCSRGGTAFMMAAPTAAAAASTMRPEAACPAVSARTSASGRQSTAGRSAPTSPTHSRPRRRRR